MDTFGKQASSYGSFAPDSHGHGDGNHTHDGYALVFRRITPQFTLSIAPGNKLVAEENSNFEETKFLCITKSKRIKLRLNPEDMLDRLRQRGIVYSLKYSNDFKKQYVIACISMPYETAEEWADRRDLAVHIEPIEAVKAGRAHERFALAKNTFLPDIDSSNMTTGDDGTGEYKMLELAFWQGIHIPFEGSINRNIYKKYKDGSVLNSRLFLRVLFEVLTDDFKMGGAGFKIDRFASLGNHPFESIFAINDSCEKKPELQGKWWQPNIKDQRRKTQQIREYYGELIGFYFAFLFHYNLWLFGLAPLGTIWFIVQLAEDSIQARGGMFIVLIAIIWSTLMLENWYRREYKLKFKWGMWNYSVTEAPRPSFKGQAVVSPTTGEIVEVYSSVFMYYTRIFFSLGSIFFCICCVIAAVVGIWILKRLHENNQYWSIGVGIINSVQITIFNILYTYFALWLNEKEGHRLEEEYYNHLVTKRVLFYIVNSFNSLVYLGFWKSYDSNDECLEAVRTQLVTLFISAIFIQNFIEILLPKIIVYAKEYFAKREAAQHEEQQHAEQALVTGDEHRDTAPINDGDQRLNTMPLEDEETKDDAVALELPEDESGADAPPAIFRQLTVSPTMWDDIFVQLEEVESPAVLDNTAEIVVQYGYIMLFVVVFPLMPVLAIVNNYFEFRVDFYNFTQARRPVPIGAPGLGVWKYVLSTFATVAVFSNLAICTWKSDLVDKWIGHTDNNDKAKMYRIIFFFVTALCLLAFQWLIRSAIPDLTGSTQEGLERQEACERYLLMADLKGTARAEKVKKQQSHAVIDVAAAEE